MITLRGQNVLIAEHHVKTKPVFSATNRVFFGWGGQRNTKPAPGETARYLDNYALEIVLSVEVCAILTNAATCS